MFNVRVVLSAIDPFSSTRRSKRFISQHVPDRVAVQTDHYCRGGRSLFPRRLPTKSAILFLISGKTADTCSRHWSASIVVPKEFPSFLSSTVTTDVSPLGLRAVCSFRPSEDDDDDADGDVFFNHNGTGRLGKSLRDDTRSDSRTVAAAVVFESKLVDRLALNSKWCVRLVAVTIAL